MFKEFPIVEIFRHGNGWFLRWDGEPTKIIDGGKYCVQGFATFDSLVVKARQLFGVGDEPSGEPDRAEAEVNDRLRPEEEEGS